MKNVLKLTTVLAICFAVAFSFSSCDKDECYECSLSGSDTETICEGDDDGNGGTVSEDELDAAVLLLEAFGYDCKKK